MSAFTSIFGGSNANTAPPSTATSVGASANSNAIKDQIKKELETELATANATELVNKLTETCFEKCPSGEDACIGQCVQKYMVSWNVISQTYLGLIQNVKR